MVYQLKITTAVTTYTLSVGQLAELSRYQIQALLVVWG